MRNEIKRHGEEYTFYRRDKNEFGEDTGEEKEVKVLKGLYHEERGYVKLKTEEGANIKSKPEPQLLCIIEYENIEEGENGDGGIYEDGEDEEKDVEILKASSDGSVSSESDEPSEPQEPSEQEPTFSTEVVQGDYVIIRGATYKVVDVVDIQNYGIIANVSLELVV